jgi:hypothetical protein
MIALALVGCIDSCSPPSLPPPPPPPLPTATFDGVSWIGLGWEEARAEVQLTVDNPLPVDVPLSGGWWSLEIGGRPFARGIVAPVTLTAGGPTSFSAPFSIRYVDIPAAVGGGLPYHATGSLEVETPLRTVPLWVDHEGMLPELSAPSVGLVGVSLTREGTAGRASLDLALGLPSWVGTGSLGWSMTAGEGVLVKGSAVLADGGHLALVLLLDPGAMATASWEAWKGTVKTVELGLDGVLQSSYGTLPIAWHTSLAIPWSAP